MALLANGVSGSTATIGLRILALEGISAGTGKRLPFSSSYFTLAAGPSVVSDAR